MTMRQSMLIRMRRQRRARRTRVRVRGTADRPRLSVFRSHRHLSAQLIDDVRGRTLASAFDREVASAQHSGPVSPAARARAVGERIAAKAKAAGITAVRFDRGRYAYHGAVRALAEGARGGGLAF